MADVVEIDDPRDERLADYVDLRDRDLRRRHAPFFIAEGALVIRHLLHSRYRLRSVLLTGRGLDDLAGDLEEVDAPVYVVSQAVIESIAGFHFHRGSLASADRGVVPDAAAVLEGARLLLVAEGVNDHENLGALFRNAAAFGVDAVLLDPTCADPLYRRAIRVSMGHVLRVPFARAQQWPHAISELRDAGFETLALTPALDAADLATLDVHAGRRALLVGAEGPGLSAAVLAAAHHRVRIALAPGVDSLNVATAAAITLHYLALRGGREVGQQA